MFNLWPEKSKAITEGKTKKVYSTSTALPHLWQVWYVSSFNVDAQDEIDEWFCAPADKRKFEWLFIRRTWLL